MSRRMGMYLTGAALAAAVLPGCSGTASLQGSHDAEERIVEGRDSGEEDLLSGEFVRGGRAGLAKARATGRGAMLLFVASW